MKKASSTKHDKNGEQKFDFKNALKPSGKESPQRKYTGDVGNNFGQHSARPPKEKETINISPASSDEEGEKSSSNTFGFVPMNNLLKSNKGHSKQALTNRLVGKSNERKDDKLKASQFKVDKNKLKGSHSIKASDRYRDRGLDTRRKKDTMNLHQDPSWLATQEWQNEKNLDSYPNLEIHSKRTKKNKLSRVGSKEGSKRVKRHRRIISSVHSRREKSSRSRQNLRRLPNRKNLVVFNEYKTEDKLDKDIGIQDDQHEVVKEDAFHSEDNEMKFDDSYLDEAVSYEYTLGDRSCSFSGNDESFMKEKEGVNEEEFLEIVEQDSFEKLNNYRDRFPLLGLRKLIMRIKLIITKLAFVIISHWLFEYCSLMVIIANSIVLALEDPTNPGSNSTGFLATLDVVFLVLYTLEMVLKILGLGFILNKGSYLRDSWNILDFIIVLSAYLQLLISSGANLSVLRSFRVLRPLRTISGIEGLRVIVSALMKAITLLVDTVIILVFFFIIFAIAGVQLWSGVLKKRCVSIETGAWYEPEKLCGAVSCPDGYFCGKTNENPDYGVTNFDNIFYSLLIVFQSVTLEGWSVIMVYVQKTFNYVMSLFFFIPLVFIGAFFLLNLTLVVIKSKFTEEHEANKERKKHRKYVLKKMSKREIQQQKEAKRAFKRLKIKNQKVRNAKGDFKDSDDSMAERKHNARLENLKIDPITAGDPDTTTKLGTAKLNSKGEKKIRPSYGISDLHSKIKKRNPELGDPITEEMSNSEFSMPNKTGAFYPSNLSANGKPGSTKYGATTREKNVLYLKTGKGKLKMEGVYGISRVHDGNGAELLENDSDLFGSIPLTDDENEAVDKGDENEVVLPDSDLMFPLDSSFTSSSKHGKKNLDPKNDKKTTIKNEDEGSDKQDFSISDNSYDLNNDSYKLSPDKSKNLDRKNTNYFTATNLSSADNTDMKSASRTNKMLKGKTLRTSRKPEKADKPSDSDKKADLKPFRKLMNHIIPASSQQQSPDVNLPNGSSDSTLGLLGKDFSIKNILFSHLKKQKETHDSKILEEFQNQEEGDGETPGTPGKAASSKASEDENIEEMDPEDIQVVSKGMKVKVKKDTKFNDAKHTPFDTIILQNDEQDTSKPEPKNQEKPPKTTLPPYTLRREMELNEILLEGKVDDEEEEKEKAQVGRKEQETENKTEDMKNFKPGDKLPVDDEEEEKPAEIYLEKFKFPYRANVIATGTISVVLTVKNLKPLMEIPNPCAEIYGGRIEVEDDEPSFNETRSKINEKHGLRRNDTMLPGSLLRQNTNTSKGFPRKARTAKRIFTNKNTMKKKAKEEEDHSDENVLKKLIMDIPEDSPFYKKIDMEAFKKQQEEDEKLEEEDDDITEEYEESTQADPEELDDLFLDRNIDFDTEIDRACKNSAKKQFDRTEWSGQDVKFDYDPYFAKLATKQLSASMVYPYGIQGIYSKIRGYLRAFVKSSFFENFMTVAVAINTIVLALDYHGISDENKNTLTTMNFYFTIIFIVEMTFKLLGLGPINYLKDKMNYLDGMVVMLSIFELAFLSGGGALSAFRAVRIMRTFRVLRVARLLKSMQSMQTIMDVIARSISSFLYLALLLLLFIFIYALLGMQTFGGRFDFEDGKPRGNFDTFNKAFVTVFQLLTMENWQIVLYDCMRSGVNKIIVAFYLISWIFLGNFMLLNLFLAILLDSFAEEDEVDAQKKKSAEELKQDELEAKNEFMRRQGEDLIMDYSDTAMSNRKNNKTKTGGFVKQTKKKVKNDKLMDESFELEDIAMKKKKTEIKEKKPDYWGVECVRSFYIFHYNNFIRKLCYKMTNHYLFENVVLILIILSSIKLAYDTYILNLDSGTTQQQVSSIIDQFFTFFFLFEAIVKCISLGFVQDKGSYLRESWNQLDFFIVCASLFDLAFDGVNIPAIRILRLLRTLRPLRFISHNSDMKLIVTALLESVGHIINVVVVVLMVWLMFAILAVNLFSGKLFYCSENTYEIETQEE